MVFSRSRSRWRSASVWRSAALAGASYRKPLKTGMLILTPTAPYQLGMCSSRTGASPTTPKGAHRGPPEVVLGVAEFLCGRDLELQRLDFRTLLESLLNERLDVAGRGREWTGFFDQLEILLRGIAENRGKAGKRGLIVVAGFQQDRKSTRLNSSHQIISYAVICLKKKIE